MENGSGLLNNGTLRLKNSSIANGSDWIDNSISGALSGTGMVIFNSTNNHNFSGLTNFYTVQINSGGLNLGNNLTISHLLQLVNGKINTSANFVFLNNNSASSFLNDVTNAGYVHSWINGNFRRLITSNTSTYDFPVGSGTRSNLLQFVNNSITGTSYLTASFGPKPGTDAGLNVTESTTYYTGVNNGGVWYLIPNTAPSGGNFALQLYFNGFTGLADNKFGILRRPDASSNGADWIIPPGSSLEANNGLGRKVSDGFARRKQISSFSQLGIGMLANVPNVVACSHPQGFYGNARGTACYTFNGSSSMVSSTQLMQNAFVSNSKVFGSVANRQFFTLFRSDINSGNIFKMLPGSGNSQALMVDNVPPYDGAYFSDPSTWSLVPIQSGGSQNGKINNQLLSQLITLWFNISTSSTLGPINLSRDTLVTTAQTACGSGVPTGSAVKFGILHNVIVYLNGGNGYANTINGLFQLANDVLGGANTAISAADAQIAVATINNAFDGCRILTGTIAYSQPGLITKISAPGSASSEMPTEKLLVTAFPNPYDRQFSLSINSLISGMAVIEFFTANGTKVLELRKYVADKITNVVPYAGPHHSGTLIYKVTVGNYHASGFVIGIN
ncbi:MAG: hypothetical protein E6H06_10740 [Bacteroidetes bacterium]|nr:MAG: hypothetical protein E6H06_10740 [Bacteroidota bacterium]